MSIHQKFWNKVERNEITECLEWTGRISKDGYGCFVSKKKYYTAHRVAYQICIGDIPRGLFICHKCDNRKCVNPLHLFIGTHQDNMNDMVRKGRSKNSNKNKTFCKHNHEFTIENTKYYNNIRYGTPMRQCITCTKNRVFKKKVSKKS